MDLYGELCLGRGATEHMIKENYRKMAKQYHPDKAGDNFDKEKWAKILHAYDILSDQEKRKIYDETGDDQSKHQKSLEDIAVDILIEGIDAAANHVINRSEHNFDLVESIKNHIAKKRDGTESDIKNMAKALRELWLFRRKFIRAEGRTAILISVVKGKIGSIRAQKKQAERFLDVLAKASELMIFVEFDYTPEEIDQFLGVGRASASNQMFHQFGDTTA
ncbi:MAG: J domain-containing protein [Desulfobacteraceae bacterium]|nr:J domain-containing protein [Desulfobacteraceae bacterium]